LGVSALALLPSTLLIGATFPCAVAAWGASPARAGEAVGRLYAVNTAGAIVGTVLAGFVLVPALGVHVTLQAGIVVNLLLAASLAVAWPRPVPRAALGHRRRLARGGRGHRPRACVGPQGDDERPGDLPERLPGHRARTEPGRRAEPARGAVLPRRPERDGRRHPRRRHGDPPDQRQGRRLHPPGGRADAVHGRPPAAPAPPRPPKRPRD